MNIENQIRVYFLSLMVFVAFAVCVTFAYLSEQNEDILLLLQQCN